MNLLSVNVGSLVNFTSNYPTLGWAIALLSVFVLFIFLLERIFRNFPLFEKYFGQLSVSIAGHIRFKRFQRNAIKHDIQGTVNYAVKTISEELPENNIKPIEVQYVRETSKESFINNGKIFVRVKPVENQDDNFLNILPLYLECVLIPNAKPLLSIPQLKAITYYTEKKIVGDRSVLKRKLHDEYFLNDAKNYIELKPYFSKIEKIDSKGLFFSVFLRVIERGSNNLRFTNHTMKNEFNAILEHIVNFVVNFEKKTLIEQMWEYKKPKTSFSLLLVARPEMAALEKYENYIKRLLEHLVHTDFVYVVFSKSEWTFGEKVAQRMENLGGVSLVETIKTFNDYRGEKNGIIKAYKKSEVF